MRQVFAKLGLSGHSLVVTTYSDPQDRNLFVAEALLPPDPLSEGFGLPTAEEIILRLIYGWMVLRIQTLCDLSQYSQRTVERALSVLSKQGAVRRLGFPKEGPFCDTKEHLYMVGPTPPRPGPYEFRPRLRSRKWTRESAREANSFLTSDKLLVPAHPYLVAEVAAWLAGNLAARGYPCLAIPEQVLRKEYQWCSILQPREGGFFHTPIPDAWLIYNKFSLRLEVQLSETKPENLRAVIENSPLHEPVLYVVPDHGPMYEYMKPLLADYDHLAVVRMWNEEDLAAVQPRHQNLVEKNKFQQWWMRDWYSAERFVYSVMNPKAAFLFGNRPPSPDRERPGQG